MAKIRVSTFIDRPPDVVWGVLENISSHVEWMADAESITFRPGPRSGVGTTFECRTRVGPLRTTDVMEITEWKPGRAMGVRHVGLVRGEGRFRLKARRGGTRFVWRERLRFPWWLGGPLGAAVGSVPLRLIWRANLRRLKASVERRA